MNFVFRRGICNGADYAKRGVIALLLNSVVMPKLTTALKLSSRPAFSNYGYGA
jgi:hypothetical protein